jgi:16S rRNA (cytosine1402-N4)-methyltransferase
VHRSVLLQESVALVCGADQGGGSAGAIREGVYVDATFGRGGHTRRLLELLGPASIVVGLDRDPAAVAAGQALAREDARLRMCHGNFAELGAVLDELGIDAVQGVLMDLGVSSPQLDDAERGFSFRFDAPLDMRMDTSRGITAAEWLNTAEQGDIARVLKVYGEERFAKRIAAAIVAARPLATTVELAELVRSAQPRPTPGKHPATRVFQAVRMQVNEELEALEAGLAAAFERLVGGGRLAVISFHSLEDRAVKHYFRELTSPPQLPRGVPVRGPAAAPRARAVGRPRTPAEAELQDNPRARSARLRVVEKAA